MELKDYIEAGINKFGTAVSLAKQLGQNANLVRDAKAHRKGLPNYACVMLADLLEVERIEVIAASELVTEKNPERQKVWLPFVLAAEARELARVAQQNGAAVATAETKTAPVREPSEKLVASRGIEPRTRGFSMGFFPRIAANPHATALQNNTLAELKRNEAQSAPDSFDRKVSEKPVMRIV